MAKGSKKKKKAQHKNTNAKKTNVDNSVNSTAEKITKDSQKKDENNASQQTTKTNNSDTNNAKEEKTKRPPFFFNEKYTKRSKKYFITFIPIIIVLGYIPLLMRTLTYRTFLEGYDWFAANNATQVDVFLKIKAIVFIIVAVVMLLIMLIWFFNGKRDVFKKLKGIPFYLLGGAVLFVILSGIFADNKSLLLNGGFENFESIFVTISYFVTLIYTYLLFSQSDSINRDFQFVYRASLPGFLIVAIIGFFQAIGLDLFTTDFGKSLFASAEYLTDGAQITVGTGEYTTLHNIDYVSVFFGMWTFVFLILFSMSRDIKEKIIRGALIVLALFDMFMAGSDGGRLGFAAAVVVLLILLSIKDRKRLIITIVGIVAVIAIVFAIPQTRTRIIAGIGATNVETKYKTNHITPKDDGVYFDLDGKEYSVAYTFEKNDANKSMLKVTLKDANGNPIEGTYHEAANGKTQYYEYNSGGIAKGTVISEYKSENGLGKATSRGIRIGKEDAKTSFVVSNQADKSGKYYFMNPYNRFVQDDGTNIANANVFPNKLFSGRGEIWNKTLPILKNYLLVGCGSGLFITAFPQNNYIDKMFGNANYDVKPHNLYLQYWVEEGLPFLLLMLAFFVMFYIINIRLFVTRKGDVNYESNRRISLACMLAVTVFLVAGIAGDSMIVHSPIFWTFLGLGMATGMKEQ